MTNTRKTVGLNQHRTSVRSLCVSARYDRVPDACVTLLNPAKRLEPTDKILLAIVLLSQFFLDRLLIYFGILQVPLS